MLTYSSNIFRKMGRTLGPSKKSDKILKTFSGNKIGNYSWKTALHLIYYLREHLKTLTSRFATLILPSLTARSRNVYSVSGFNPWTRVNRSVIPDPMPTTPTVGGCTSIVYESALATDSHVRNKLLSVVESSVTRKLFGAGSAIPETCHISS